jgi:DNA-binding LacI/PurR family transcriptional regulator
MTSSAGLGKRSEDVLILLRQEIEQGMYPEGSRLESEHQLCARFGISRSTVRRAIARLITEGRVESHQGVGVIVCAPQTRALGRTITAMFRGYSEVILTLQHHAMAQSYLLNIYSGMLADYDPAHERAFFERVRTERPAGLLACLTPTAPSNDNVLATLAAAGTRIVHIEPFRLSSPEESYLFPDYRRAGYLAATQLLLNGYERLVFAGTQADWPGAKLTLRGFADALYDHRGGYDPARHYLEYPFEAARMPCRRQTLMTLLHDLPPNTGILCRSMDLANELLTIFREEGRHVPEEFGVLGVDYLEQSLHAETCDAITFDRVAGMQRAIDVITGLESYPLRDHLVPSVVKRGTVREKK